MKKEKIVTLDLTGCKYLGEIHQRIKKAFDFPDFYGENRDVFGIFCELSVTQTK